MDTYKKRILVYQLGSLGDTVITLPCYREIARRHPEADLYVLTNYPQGANGGTRSDSTAELALWLELFSTTYPLRTQQYFAAVPPDQGSASGRLVLSHAGEEHHAASSASSLLPLVRYFEPTGRAVGSRHALSQRG